MLAYSGLNIDWVLSTRWWAKPCNAICYRALFLCRKKSLTVGMLTKRLWEERKSRKKKKKHARRRHYMFQIRRLRFKAVAERRQWSAALTECHTESPPANILPASPDQSAATRTAGCTTGLFPHIQKTDPVLLPATSENAPSVPDPLSPPCALPAASPSPFPSLFFYFTIFLPLIRLC